jgi:CRP/FNR family transcriptional regulator
MCSVDTAAGECSCLNDVWSNPALRAEQVRASSSQVLFEPNASADHVWSVEKGQVRIYQMNASGARLLKIIGPGQWFGSASLANLPTYGKRAMAVGTTLLRRVTADDLMSFLGGQSPHVAIKLVRELALKLSEAQEDAARLAFDDCNSRLIKALVRFSQSAAAETDGEQVVLRITHQQLAQAVGAARETVSLALTELRQQKLLQTGRNQLVFNPRILREWFEGRGNVRSMVEPLQSVA